MTGLKIDEDLLKLTDLTVLSRGKARVFSFDELVSTPLTVLSEDPEDRSLFAVHPDEYWRVVLEGEEFDLIGQNGNGFFLVDVDGVVRHLDVDLGCVSYCAATLDDFIRIQSRARACKFELRTRFQEERKARRREARRLARALKDSYSQTPQAVPIDESYWAEIAAAYEEGHALLRPAPDFFMREGKLRMF